MIPVILSGGSGSRLWPLSRTDHPKQFISLHNHQSLYQNTLLRLSHVTPSPPIIVCNNDHRFVVAEHTREIGVKWDRIIVEPLSKNTAPAIAIAAIAAINSHGDECILCILPADHVIKNQDAFATAVKQAEQAALTDHIVTFGVNPTEPQTDYGYIQIGSQIEPNIYMMAAFKEKPDLETAQTYAGRSDYYWNSGMLVSKASVLIEELQTYSPDIWEWAQKAYQHAHRDTDFLRLDQNAFQHCPAMSIDHAIMERTKRGAVVMLDAEWSDIGAWHTVWKVSDKDGDGNVCKGDVVAVNTSDSYIHAGGKLVAVLGLTDVLVIDTEDAILVADKAHALQVKKIVEKLKAEGRCA